MATIPTQIKRRLRDAGYNPSACQVRHGTNNPYPRVSLPLGEVDRFLADPNFGTVGAPYPHTYDSHRVGMWVHIYA